MISKQDLIEQPVFTYEQFQEEFFPAIFSQDFGKLKELYELNRLMPVITDYGFLESAVICTFPGNQQTVEFIINLGIDFPNFENNEKASIIQNASFAGNDDTVLYLFGNITDDNFLPIYGGYLIDDAARSGSIKLIDFYMSKGFDPGKINAEGQTCLNLAAENGNMDLIKYLVETLGIAYDNININGDNIIFNAARGGNLEAIKYFEEKGLDINMQNAVGFYPIHVAAYDTFFFLDRGYIDVINYYVDEKGVNIDIEDVSGRTPLFYASYQAVDHSLDIMKYLIEKGADINHQGSMQETPVSFCILANNFEGAKLLIESGADLSIPDLYDNTPLMILNANLSQFIVDNYTALNTLEMIKLLIDNGADFKAINQYGNNTLMSLTDNLTLFAVSDQSAIEAIKLLRFLVDNGTNPNVADTYGNTAMMMLTANLPRVAISDQVAIEAIEFLKYFIGKGVDLDASNNEGQKAYDIALLLGMNGVADVLNSANYSIVQEETIITNFESVVNDTTINYDDPQEHVDMVQSNIKDYIL